MRIRHLKNIFIMTLIEMWESKRIFGNFIILSARFLCARAQWRGTALWWPRPSLSGLSIRNRIKSIIILPNQRKRLSARRLNWLKCGRLLIWRKSSSKVPASTLLRAVVWSIISNLSTPEGASFTYTNVWSNDVGFGCWPVAICARNI